MRRLRQFLFPLLILVLVACGGTKSSNAPDGSGDRVLAAASGKVDPNVPAGPPAPPDAPAENVAQGLAIEDITYTPARGGGLTVSGKVANRGAQGAKVISISVELLDAAGQRITRTAFYNPNLPTIAAGGETQWQGHTPFQVADGQSVRLSVDGEIADTGN